MPRFEPFAAFRFSHDDLAAVTAPPYDVLSEHDLDELEQRHPHNIVHVDVPRERDGDDRYSAAGDRLRRWVDEGVMIVDDEPSFTLYRMSFGDEAGARREMVGVLGALEVVDHGAGEVLPHERVTPKASSDRLDLTHATNANLSPIWGLSLATDLTTLLAEPGDPVGEVVVGGVTHRVERVTDPARMAAISALVWSDDVLLADGHHRYGVARTYRDEVRAATGSEETPAELTLAFVSELVAEQLNVAAIHRVYRNIGRDELVAALSRHFDIEAAGAVTTSTPALMDEQACLCLVDRDGSASWLRPRAGAFDDLRAIDGVWLEHALADTVADVAYQHGVDELLELLDEDSTVTAAVMIRPVSVAEIERTAREGLLMPPKSTFFAPKLLTGLVVRPLD